MATKTFVDTTMMPEAISDSVLVRSLGVALVRFVWQGAVVGLFTSAALALLHQGAATTRYLVASVGLLIMFLLPVATTLEQARGLSADPASMSAMLGSASPMTVPPERVSTTGRSVEPAFVSLVHQATDRLRPTIVALWLVGVGVLSVRLLAGWFLAERLRRRGTRPISEPWRRRVETLSGRLRISRPIRVLESVVVGVPATIGWLRPVLLIPTGALVGLSPSQLEAVVAHELAHVRRHDYLVNGLQTAIETLLFYHPAVWWISKRIRIEREHCCDDVALGLCGDSLTYGRALAALDQMRPADGALVLGASGGSVAGRIRRFAGGPTPAQPRLVAGLTLGCVATACLSVLVYRPSEAATTVGERPVFTQPAGSQEPVRAGDDVPPPAKTRHVDPVYPEAAKAQQVSGVVVLETVIGVDGRVTDVRVLRSVPELDQAAIEAVGLWEYTPAVLDGLPVPVVMTVTINFRLTPDDADTGSQRADSTRLASPRLSAPAQEPPRATGFPPPAKTGHVDPVYPEAAKARQVSGVVMLETDIGVDGRVTDVQVLRSVPELDQAAIEAVRQWEYTPTMLNGVSVPVIMTVTVNFQLR